MTLFRSQYISMFCEAVVILGLAGRNSIGYGLNCNVVLAFRKAQLIRANGDTEPDQESFAAWDGLSKQREAVIKASKELTKIPRASKAKGIDTQDI